MIKSNTNGHEIEYIQNKNQWVYSDTKETINNPRPCKHCGENSTQEGYDGCLGYLPNVEHACCGHGIDKPYAILKDGTHLHFYNINNLKKYFGLR